MLNSNDILTALRILGQPIEFFSASNLHRQVANSLSVYEQRGELSGSLENAIECLELAGYEVSKPTPIVTAQVFSDIISSITANATRDIKQAKGG